MHYVTCSIGPINASTCETAESDTLSTRSDRPDRVLLGARAGATIAEHAERASRRLRRRTKVRARRDGPEAALTARNRAVADPLVPDRVLTGRAGARAHAARLVALVLATEADLIGNAALAECHLR